MNIMKYISKDVIRGFTKECKILMNDLGFKGAQLPLDIRDVAERLELKIVDNETVREQNKHAILENGTIKLNPADDENQKRFSIAHEIAHIIAKDSLDVKVESNNGPAVVVMTYNLINRDLKNVARGIGNTKKFDEATAGNLDLAKDIYEEVIDYFAAVILVPAVCFCDEIMKEASEDEMSEIFGVKPSCIAKRKEELFYELEAYDDNMPSMYSGSGEAAAWEDVQAIIESWK